MYMYNESPSVPERKLKKITLILEGHRGFAPHLLAHMQQPNARS